MFDWENNMNASVLLSELLETKIGRLKGVLSVTCGRFYVVISQNQINSWRITVEYYSW